ncbi:hypothetical protein G7Z17_g6279 [Cylindrodendrum hubeiense]|uniref:Uncharacterized protein n=1 Tax=Cylindrodendrum hubeiense TaxID=595255 RepID=A0A9P5H5P0_9HYPO|nr:hypothetical protein G7Z17_g6279 [Cylindrodendrum hubeiense]
MTHGKKWRLSPLAGTGQAPHQIPGRGFDLPLSVLVEAQSHATGQGRCEASVLPTQAHPSNSHVKASAAQGSRHGEYRDQGHDQGQDQEQEPSSVAKNPAAASRSDPWICACKGCVMSERCFAVEAPHPNT